MIYILTTAHSIRGEKFKIFYGFIPKLESVLINVYIL